jgi:aspartate aminotransferase
LKFKSIDIYSQGMFAYTGLNPRQCQVLIQQHHIYIMSDGRINVCAITQKNADEVAQKFYDVITNVTADPKL